MNCLCRSLLLLCLVLATGACTTTRKTISTSPEERVRQLGEELPKLVTGGRVSNVDWSDDGNFLTFTRTVKNEPQRVRFDLQARREVPVEASPATQPQSRPSSRPSRQGPARGRQRDRETSPDGKWVAFTSRDGLSVTRTTFDSTASIMKAVPGTWAAVRWTADGREILYNDHRRLFAVGVQTRGVSVESTEPRFLFQHDGLATTWDIGGFGWDLAPNGRLLLWQPQAQGPTSQLNVITSLPALVAARVNAGLTTR